MYNPNMKALLIEPDGSTTLIPKLNEGIIRKHVGEQHEKLTTKDGLFTVLVDELRVVADLPINSFVSSEVGLVIGGKSILFATTQQSKDKEIFTQSYKAQIKKTNSDKQLRERLEALYAKNKRKNFVFYEPDRWLYNPSFFDSIVVGEADDHLESDVPRYNIWFFKGRDVKPFFIKIVEYSLREVLEDLILGDEAMANGEPPPHFSAAISHFTSPK
jgi:hypothetical protein